METKNKVLKIPATITLTSANIAYITVKTSRLNGREFPAECVVADFWTDTGKLFKEIPETRDLKVEIFKQLWDDYGGK